MKHMFKAILAIALSLMLALPMFALADGEVLEGENQVVEQVEGQGEGTEGEKVIDATPTEVEMDLPEPDEEPAEEEPAEEEPAEEEPVKEEPAEEEPVEEEPSEEEPVEEEPSDEEPVVEETIEEEPVMAEPVEDQPVEDQPAEAQAAEALPVANELVYTGEPQALVSVPGEGAFLFSLDGENYGVEIPTAINAGEYTVYYRAVGEGETLDAAASLTVIIAKADVTLIPPIALNVVE